MGFLSPSFGKGCQLYFTLASVTDVALAYKISIRLWNSGDGMRNIELTATYSGQFNERHIFDASITRFWIAPMPSLAIDQV